MAAGMIVYVSCHISGEIVILRFDPGSGGVEERDRVMVGTGVMPLAVSPDRRHLYAALRDTQPQIASFRVDPLSGALTEIGRFDQPDSLPYISTDRNGRFLLCASFQNSLIKVLPIGPRGVVQPGPVCVEHGHPTAHCILTDPANRFLVSPVRDSDVVLMRRFDAATGMLSPNDPSVQTVRHGAGPRHFVFHPNNRWAYVVNELDATVDGYGYDMATGRLSYGQTVALVSGGSEPEYKAADIAITADGRFLYASERKTSTVSAFAIDTNSGKLSAVGHYATEHWPRTIHIDPCGGFLLCAGQRSSSMTVHAIDRETGALTEVSRHPMGEGSSWVEIVDLP